MNYTESIAYIKSKKKFGSKLGLERIYDLLEAMGNPQDSLKIIHIAGTNGKGSVASFLTHAFIEAGYKTGTFTSPYIEYFEERVRINFRQINKNSLSEICNYIKEKENKLMKKKKIELTEFEIITAIAFEYYKREGVDIAIMEVGLGGRFDATNIINNTKCSVITKIGMDHTQYLGDTIEKIAFEKAGIIKENSVVFTIEQNNDAMKVLKNVSKEKKADLRTITPKSVLESSSIDGQVFWYKDKKIRIDLIGEHQRENAILAYEILKYMKIDEENILKGLQKAKWPGRLEILKRKPLCLVDGAHNVDGVISLKNTIIELFSDKKIIFIMAVMKDKNYVSMVEEIADYAKMFISVDIDNDRALKAYELAFVIKTYCNNVVKSDRIEEAIEIALNEAEDDDVIIIFGSLYYIGEVKRIFKNKED